jgi:ABC-2 type transport system ATP-binding protein
MAAVIQVEELRKRYGGVTAVDGVGFQVAEREVFGIVGPNGAGKTTTVEIVEGLRRPDGGRVRVLGLDPGRDGPKLRQRIGAQLQRAALPDRLRVWEALDLYASFYARAVPWSELLDRWGLAERRTAAVGALSGGQRQRLLIALALVGRPEVVFLDELTTGLDPQARRATWELVRSVRDAGATVVLVTHLMEEAERLCDRVAVIDRGRLVALDTPRALVARAGTANLDDAFPLLLLWLNGGDGNQPRAELGGRGVMDVLAPGFVAMVLAEVGLTSLPGLLSSYRERGVLRRLAVTPVSPTRLLAAQLLAHLAAATAGAALVVGLGMTMFGLNPPRDPARLLAAYLLGALALLAIGSVLAALAPTPRVAEAAGLVVFFPMIFLSGAVVPRESLSDGMRRIGELLPLTPVVDGLRAAWDGSGPGLMTLAALAAILVVATAVAARTFRWE